MAISSQSLLLRSLSDPCLLCVQDGWWMFFTIWVALLVRLRPPLMRFRPHFHPLLWGQNQVRFLKLFSVRRCLTRSLRSRDASASLFWEKEIFVLTFFDLVLPFSRESQQHPSFGLRSFSLYSISHLTAFTILQIESFLHPETVSRTHHAPLDWRRVTWTSLLWIPVPRASFELQFYVLCSPENRRSGLGLLVQEILELLLPL